MTPNQILQRITEAARLTDEQLLEILALGQIEASLEDVGGWRTGELPCPEATLLAFLDGFILKRRGPPTSGRSAPPPPAALTNNTILKKLRIALALHEPDVLRILEAGGQPLTSRELTPLFRKAGTKHYRACDDAVLEAFLAGLAAAP